MVLALLSDIHGNLSALQSILKTLNEYPVDRIINLGDIVGYGPEPEDCIRHLRGKEVFSIAGNHERAVLKQLDISYFNELARTAILWTREQLSPGSIAYLRSLKESWQENGFLFVHGAVHDPDAYVFARREAISNLQEVKHLYPDVFFVFAGHTHVRGIYTENERTRTLEHRESVTLATRRRYFINPGSVGQPRDSDPRAKAGLLDTETGRYTQLAVAYDIDTTYNRIIDAGLPPELAIRLKKGL